MGASSGAYEHGAEPLGGVNVGSFLVSFSRDRGERVLMCDCGVVSSGSR